MGVVLDPFRHFMILVFQGAVNRKVWEAGVDAEQLTADVIIPAVISEWCVLSLPPVPSVSFLTEGSKRESIKTLALCHLTVVSGKVLGNRFSC